MIVNHYADSIGRKNECMSSEEMRAGFEEFNGYEDNIRKQCKVISMDVKALYPSMSWDAIVTAVKEMIMESGLLIESLDWREIGKYIAVMVPTEVIEREGLTNSVPKRKGRPGKERTINFLQSKKNDQKWTVARKPGVRQQKKMLALVISAGVKMVMSNHTYKVGDIFYHQAEGGAIGLELTGAVSRPFMIRWDRLYLEKVRKAGVTMRMYERYIDDSNQIAVVPPPGAKYDGNKNKVVIDIENINENEQDEDRLARILTDIANTIQEGIG